MDEKVLRSVGEVVDDFVKKHVPEAPSFGDKPGEPVPEVDPDDVRVVFELAQRAQKHHPGQHVAIGIELMTHACKPGADVQATWYRATQLYIMNELVQMQLEPFNKLLLNNEAAFRAAAKIPLQWMSTGFDPELFVRFCEGGNG